MLSNPLTNIDVSLKKDMIILEQVTAIALNHRFCAQEGDPQEIFPAVDVPVNSCNAQRNCKTPKIYISDFQFMIVQLEKDRTSVTFL